MGYELGALLTRRSVLESATGAYRSIRSVALSPEIMLVPMTEDLEEEMMIECDSTDDVPDAHFDCLTPQFAGWARDASKNGLVAYVEAGYFGGSGSQSAIVWENGQRTHELLHKSDAINVVLRLLGVHAAAGMDEFDTIGLGRCRRTARWLKSEE